MSKLKFLIPLLAALALTAAVACTSAPASQPGDDTTTIVDSGDPSDQPIDGEQTGTERVEAPITDVTLRATRSLPPQYSLHVTSGLPNTCNTFETVEVSRSGDQVTVKVYNQQQTGPVACGERYGIIENDVDLGSDFDPGVTYDVRVNDFHRVLVGGESAFSEDTGSESGLGINPNPGLVPAPIESVVLNVMESFPVQYSLDITYGLTSGCAEFDNATLVREGDRVAVIVQNSVPTGEVACTDDYRTGTETVTLGSDFKDGVSYTIRINDRIFVLADFALTERQSTDEPGESYERISVQAQIENVMLTATRSIPAQYGLSVTTILSGGCAESAPSEVMRESGPDGDVLTVLIFNLMPSPRAEVECTAQIRYAQESFNIGELADGEILTIHINDQAYTLRGGDFDVMPIKGERPNSGEGSGDGSMGDSGDGSGESDSASSGSDEAMEEPTSSEGYKLVEVEAGIENVTVSASKSLPPQYRLHIVSILSGGCESAAPVSMRREGDNVTIVVSNWAPAPDELVMCTAQIGYEETSVEIGEVAIGESVNVHINGSKYTLTGGEFELK
jgi:hypothetical protein